MTQAPVKIADLFVEAASHDALDDALRAIREMLPLAQANEEHRGYRREAVLLQAQLRDLSQAQRVGIITGAAYDDAYQDLVSKGQTLLLQARRGANARHVELATAFLDRAILARRQESPFAQSQGQLFLSYRRSDSADVTGRIRERLAERFGARSIFMDIDSIPLGVDFRAHIVSTIARCSATLVVIGPHWVDAVGQDGKRRLEEENDPIRTEIETALQMRSPVIPILVGNAKMPRADLLPSTIQDLSTRNALPVRPDPDFPIDVQRLMSRLDEQVI